MGVKKTLNVIYDLATINEQQSSQLISANEDIIKSAESQKKKQKNAKKLTDKEKEKEQKNTDKRLDKLKEIKSKDKETDTLDTVEEFLDGKAGANFFLSKFKSSLPIIGPILAVSSFFINELLKLDVLTKKFLDIADTRISVFVNRQEQARLDTHLDQIIYTTKAGTSAPRDSYNSFNSYDRVLKIEGRDRDASSIGGVD
jgi:hypothetical protein